LFERFAIDPCRAVYVDDHERNVKAAAALGMFGIHFTGAAALRQEFRRLGLLPATERVEQG
jgi:2-haloacid dehalogenase